MMARRRMLMMPVRARCCNALLTVTREIPSSSARPCCPAGRLTVGVAPEAVAVSSQWASRLAAVPVARVASASRL